MILFWFDHRLFTAIVEQASGMSWHCQFGFPNSIAAHVAEFEDAAVIVTVVPDTLHAPAIAEVPCTVTTHPGLLV